MTINGTILRQTLYNARIGEESGRLYPSNPAVPLDVSAFSTAFLSQTFHLDIPGYPEPILINFRNIFEVLKQFDSTLEFFTDAWNEKIVQQIFSCWHVNEKVALPAKNSIFILCKTAHYTPYHLAQAKRILTTYLSSQINVTEETKEEMVKARVALSPEKYQGWLLDYSKRTDLTELENYIAWYMVEGIALFSTDFCRKNYNRFIFRTAENITIEFCFAPYLPQKNSIFAITLFPVDAERGELDFAPEELQGIIDDVLEVRTPTGFHFGHHYLKGTLSAIIQGKTYFIEKDLPLESNITNLKTHLLALYRRLCRASQSSEHPFIALSLVLATCEIMKAKLSPSELTQFVRSTENLWKKLANEPLFTSIANCLKKEVPYSLLSAILQLALHSNEQSPYFEGQRSECSTRMTLKNSNGVKYFLQFSDSLEDCFSVLGKIPSCSEVNSLIQLLFNDQQVTFATLFSYLPCQNPESIFRHLWHLKDFSLNHAAVFLKKHFHLESPPEFWPLCLAMASSNNDGLHALCFENFSKLSQQRKMKMAKALCQASLRYGFEALCALAPNRNLFEVFCRNLEKAPLLEQFAYIKKLRSIFERLSKKHTSISFKNWFQSEQESKVRNKFEALAGLQEHPGSFYKLIDHYKSDVDYFWENYFIPLLQNNRQNKYLAFCLSFEAFYFGQPSLIVFREMFGVLEKTCQSSDSDRNFFYEFRLALNENLPKVFKNLDLRELCTFGDKASHLFDAGSLKLMQERMVYLIRSTDDKEILKQIARLVLKLPEASADLADLLIENMVTTNLSLCCLHWEKSNKQNKLLLSLLDQVIAQNSAREFATLHHQIKDWNEEIIEKWQQAFMALFLIEVMSINALQALKKIITEKNVFTLVSSSQWIVVFKRILNTQSKESVPIAAAILDAGIHCDSKDIVLFYDSLAKLADVNQREEAWRMLKGISYISVQEKATCWNKAFHALQNINSDLFVELLYAPESFLLYSPNLHTRETYETYFSEISRFVHRPGAVRHLPKINKVYRCAQKHASRVEIPYIDILLAFNELLLANQVLARSLLSDEATPNLLECCKRWLPRIVQDDATFLVYYDIFIKSNDYAIGTTLLSILKKSFIQSKCLRILSIVQRLVSLPLNPKEHCDVRRSIHSVKLNELVSEVTHYTSYEELMKLVEVTKDLVNKRFYSEKEGKKFLQAIYSLLNHKLSHDNIKPECILFGLQGLHYFQDESTYMQNLERILHAYFRALTTIEKDPELSRSIHNELISKGIVIFKGDMNAKFILYLMVNLEYILLYSDGTAFQNTVPVVGAALSRSYSFRNEAIKEKFTRCQALFLAITGEGELESFEKEERANIAKFRTQIAEKLEQDNGLSSFVQSILFVNKILPDISSVFLKDGYLVEPSKEVIHKLKEFMVEQGTTLVEFIKSYCTQPIFGLELYVCLSTIADLFPFVYNFYNLESASSYARRLSHSFMKSTAEAEDRKEEILGLRSHFEQLVQKVLSNDSLLCQGPGMFYVNSSALHLKILTVMHVETYNNIRKGNIELNLRVSILEEPVVKKYIAHMDQVFLERLTDPYKFIYFIKFLAKTIELLGIPGEAKGMYLSPSIAFYDSILLNLKTAFLNENSQHYKMVKNIIKAVQEVLALYPGTKRKVTLLAQWRESLLNLSKANPLYLDLAKDFT